MAQRNHEETALRMSRNNRRTVRPAMQQALSILKRDVAVVQFIVMAGQAALLENRRDAFVEETSVAIRAGCGARRQQQLRGKPAHYCFMPMPN